MYLLFYLSFVSTFLFPSWCGYMVCFHFKTTTGLVIYGSKCESVVISSSSENEWSWSAIFSCKAVGCSKKIRCQHGNVIVFVWAYKIKCTCFENIFCPSLQGKSKKKLNLPKRPLAKLQPFFVDVTIIVLTQQICLLELSNQVLELVVFLKS